jgi:hypothetical protein
MLGDVDVKAGSERLRYGLAPGPVEDLRDGEIRAFGMLAM